MKLFFYLLAAVQLLFALGLVLFSEDPDRWQLAFMFTSAALGLFLLARNWSRDVAHAMFGNIFKKD